MKKVMALAVIFVGLIFWGWLGVQLGFVAADDPDKDRAQKRQDVDLISSSVLFAIDSENWLDELTEKLKSHAEENINR